MDYARWKLPSLHLLLLLETFGHSEVCDIA